MFTSQEVTEGDDDDVNDVDKEDDSGKVIDEEADNGKDDDEEEAIAADPRDKLGARSKPPLEFNFIIDDVSSEDVWQVGSGPFLPK